MKRNTILLLCITTLISSPLNAGFRSWSNTEGIKIEAEFVKTEGDNVTLRLRNGQARTFPTKKLSKSDQEFIEANISETPKEPATTVKANRKARWQSKFSKAQAEAKETGLPILMLFTGTEWCPYCVKLEDQVFAEKEFKTFANQNLVLLMLDYEAGGTRDKELNKLKSEYGVSGFPTYFLTDASGSKLAKGGYRAEINPEQFEAWVKKAQKAAK